MSHLKNRKQKLTQGSIAPQLITLAIPLIIGSILQQLYNTIDTVVIGRFVGQTAFAGAGVAGTVMNLFVFVLYGCCTGFSIVLAQSYGSGAMDRFRNAHFLALTSGSVLTLLFSVVGLSLVDVFLRLINTPADVLIPAKQYLTVIFIGLLATFLYNFYSSVLRSIGSTGAALVFLTLSIVLNLILDLLFVGRLQMGISGAAWATVIAQFLSAAACHRYLQTTFPQLLFHREDAYLSKPTLCRLWSVSSATALHQSSLYIGKTLVQGAVNAIGIEAISAFTATTRIEGFVNSFGTSGSAAMSVFTAQNHGAGQEERVRLGFRRNLLIQFCFGLVSSITLFLAVGPALTVILGSDSPEVWNIAASYLHHIAWFYIICFIGNTFTGYFQGIGRPSIPFMGTTGHITLRVILSYTFAAQLGLNAVAYATGLGWCAGITFWSIAYLLLSRRTARPASTAA